MKCRIRSFELGTRKTENIGSPFQSPFPVRGLKHGVLVVVAVPVSCRAILGNLRTGNGADGSADEGSGAVSDESAGSGTNGSTRDSSAFAGSAGSKADHCCNAGGENEKFLHEISVVGLGFYGEAIQLGLLRHRSVTFQRL